MKTTMNNIRINNNTRRSIRISNNTSKSIQSLNNLLWMSKKLTTRLLSNSIHSEGPEFLDKAIVHHLIKREALAVILIQINKQRQSSKGKVTSQRISAA